jgi:hypothetical protein
MASETLEYDGQMLAEETRGGAVGSWSTPNQLSDQLSLGQAFDPGDS